MIDMKQALSDLCESEFRPEEDLGECRKLTEKLTRKLTAEISRRWISRFTIGERTRVDLPKGKSISGEIERISQSSVSIKGRETGKIWRIPLSSVKEVTPLK